MSGAETMGARAGDGNNADLAKLAEQAGMRVDLLSMGAASMVYSDGCEGVTREHLERFAALVAAATAVQALPSGWNFNHAQQQTDDEGPVAGVWQIGWLEVDDDYFAPIITVDTGLYYQDQDAEPLAKAILSRLAIPSPATAPTGASQVDKPCPFCGAPAKLYNREGEAHMPGAYIECTGCDMSTPIKSTAAAVIELWNQSADPDQADTITEDQAIELASALELQRAVRIVADVAALPVGGKDTDQPTQFHAGYQLACEEIAERIRTEVHVLPGGLTLPGCGPLPSIRQPAEPAPAEGASAMPSDADIEWPDIDDLAHSAAQEAYSFGISHDLFKRWMASAMFKTSSAIRAALIAKQEAAQPQPKGTACEYCDGTGDVHSLDGEWRGTCTECPAGEASARPAWVWNPARTAWEAVHVPGHYQEGALYAFGPLPEPLAQAPAVGDEKPAAWIRWEWTRSGGKSLEFFKPDELSLADEARGVVYDPLYSRPLAPLPKGWTLKATASDEPTSLREVGVGTRLPSSERLNLLGRWFEGRGMESMARICRTAASELKAAWAPWQPIETAPVGRVHSPPLRAIVAEVLCDGTPYVGEAWFDQERRRWWAANMDSSDAPGSTVDPTHWMPLPVAPASKPPVQPMGDAP